MEYVAKISELQANTLNGQMYAMDSYFNPVKDCNDDWIISEQEVENCVNPVFYWVTELPLTPWCGPYVPISGFTGNI